MFVAQDDKQLCCVLLFRNQNRTSEEQLAYADYYRSEEAAAVTQQLELVCVQCQFIGAPCDLHTHSN